MATIKKVRREPIAREFRCEHRMKEPEPRVEVEAGPVRHAETPHAPYAGKCKAGVNIYVLAAYREHEGTARLLGRATKAEAAPVKDVGGMGSRATSSTTHGCAPWPSCWVSRLPRQPLVSSVA